MALAMVSPILEKRMKQGVNLENLLTLSVISENEFWSPGLQILSDINSEYKLEKFKDEYDEKIYKFSNGVMIKNYLYPNLMVFFVYLTPVMKIILTQNGKTSLLKS